MPLYGHELDEQTDPLAAGLAFAVSLDKGSQEGEEPFIGQAALQRIAAAGPTRRLIGLKLEGKRTPRQGMNVFTPDGSACGVVTSGCLSPTLGHPIAMAYVTTAAAGAAVLSIDLGSAKADAAVVKLPFYKRG